jgi:PAS domain S-box-containing protein
MDLRKPFQGALRPKTKGLKTDLPRPSDSTSGLILIEKQSRHSIEFFNSLIHNMFHGFALFEVKYDALGKPHDFQCMEVNPAFEQVVGLKADQILGKTLSLALAESEPAWMDLCLRVAQHGGKEKFKNYFPTLRKYLEILAFCPGSGQLAAMVYDISEHEQMKKSMLNSEEGFQSIAENADNGILISYGIDTPFVYANRCAAELTGYSSNELLKLQPAQLAETSEMPKIKQRIRRRLQGMSAPKRYATALVRKDGQILPIEVYGARVIWKGQPAVMTQFRDVSFYKRVEEQLEKTNKDLERRVQERTSELMNTARELEEKKEELLRHKTDLERANRELVQTNTALSVLARNIDRSHGEFEQKIAGIVSSRVMPVIEELRHARIPEKCLAALDVMSTYLTDLTPGSAKSHEVVVALSPMEMRVAVMIKNGFSSNHIGRLLHISLDTVKTHRRSIRRKLGLRNSSINLASYLKLKIGEQTRPLPHPALEPIE